MTFFEFIPMMDGWIEGRYLQVYTVINKWVRELLHVWMPQPEHSTHAELLESHKAVNNE